MQRCFAIKGPFCAAYSSLIFSLRKSKSFFSVIGADHLEAGCLFFSSLSSLVALHLPCNILKSSKTGESSLIASFKHDWIEAQHVVCGEFQPRTGSFGSCQPVKGLNDDTTVIN